MGQYDDDPLVQLSQLKGAEREAYQKTYDKNTTRILFVVLGIAIIMVLLYFFVF